MKNKNPGAFCAALGLFATPALAQNPLVRALSAGDATPIGIVTTIENLALGDPPPNNCSGVFVIDMNTFAAGLGGGTPLPALSLSGTTVNCQFWGRDPGFTAPNNTSLSLAMEYIVGY